jgi:hypothetical protein
MKRIGLEKAFVIVLFVLVLIVFSFAERDSRKLNQLYSSNTSTQKALDLTAASNDQSSVSNAARN